jgi:hypothetical protein
VNQFIHAMSHRATYALLSLPDCDIVQVTIIGKAVPPLLLKGLGGLAAQVLASPRGFEPLLPP